MTKGLTRRKAILGIAGMGLAGLAYRYWPEDGFSNPCPLDPLPKELLAHDLVQAAWQGIDPARFRDVHVHLIGTGDSGSGMWVNPDMQSLAHPIQWLQRAFYLNASCTPDNGRSDLAYVERLYWLLEQLPAGAKSLLLAFDWFHDERGRRVPEASAFHTPNAWAASLASKYPERFEWIASIHPYRRDAVELLRKAARNGARAVKWLPPAQGMDPASPLCDSFYEAAVELDIPLLVHAGAELAVHGGNTEDFGNPLRLRRPLEHGVRVIVAHCASLGSGPDLDIGPRGPSVPSFELFSRMMDEPRYEGLLFGEISAVTQINRVGNGLKALIRRDDWHPRLLNGSDYPLPGILPLFSLQQLERRGYIQPAEARALSAIRKYNPLLFDFVLKRTVRINGRRFGPQPFHARPLLEG
jgi:mannonate dehydratase